MSELFKFFRKNLAAKFRNSPGEFQNLAISGPIGLIFFMGVRKIIIYRLVMKMLSNIAYFSFMIFWATFGGKKGVSTARAPNGLRLSNQIKKFAH